MTTPVENLRVILAGAQPPNPAELLGSKRMGALIEKLTNEAEVVIFDSPPVIAVSDAVVLAAHIDGTLLVIDSGRTRRGAAAQSVEALNAVGSHLLGAVLNRAPMRSTRYTYYYADGGQPGRKFLWIQKATRRLARSGREKGSATARTSQESATQSH